MTDRQVVRSAGRADLNWALVVFAAVMTALLGALLGFTLRYLGQPGDGRLRFKSVFYERLYARLPLLGAGFGAACGAGFAVVSQKERARQRAAARRRSRR